MDAEVNVLNISLEKSLNRMFCKINNGKKFGEVLSLRKQCNVI